MSLWRKVWSGFKKVVKVAATAGIVLVGCSSMYVGAALISFLSPKFKDLTWTCLAKFGVWVGGIFLFLNAWELFLVIAFFGAWKVVGDVVQPFKDAIKESGILKGMAKGLWRSIPTIFETLIMPRVKASVVANMVQGAPQESSLRRFIPKIRESMEQPSADLVAEWEGKNLPLPGIRRGEYKVVDAVYELHNAERAGLHIDFRFKDPNNKMVHALVLPKAKLPEVGKRPVLAVISDGGHGHERMKNPPVILEGRGKGTTRTLWEGKALLWYGDSKNLHILLDNGEAFALVGSGESGNEEFMMVRLKDSPKGGVAALHVERKFKVQDMSKTPEKVFSLVDQGLAFAEVKHDGACFTLRRGKSGSSVEVISRRISHRNGKAVKVKGGYQGIDRSYWVPELKYMSEEVLPPNSEVQVELISRSRGKFGSEHGRLSSLLMQGPVSSYEEQQRNGKIVAKVLHVDKWGGDSTDGMSRAEMRKLRERIGRRSEGLLHVPKAVARGSSARALYAREEAHGREGIMIYPKDDSKPIYKLKVQQTWDFELVGIIPVDPLKRAGGARSSSDAQSVRNPGSKWLGPNGEALGAGALLYRTESGKIGKVGSGISDELRRDLLENPDKYLGQNYTVCADGTLLANGATGTIIEVGGMSQSKTTGVVRAPVFKRMREDK